MENNENSLYSQDMDAALAEIERILDQMMVLAQLSASDLNVDRAALQKTLKRMQSKIDHIADGLSNIS